MVNTHGGNARPILEVEALQKLELGRGNHAASPSISHWTLKRPRLLRGRAPSHTGRWFETAGARMKFLLSFLSQNTAVVLEIGQVRFH